MLRVGTSNRLRIAVTSCFFLGLGALVAALVAGLIAEFLPFGDGYMLGGDPPAEVTEFWEHDPTFKAPSGSEVLVQYLPMEGFGLERAVSWCGYVHDETTVSGGPPDPSVAQPILDWGELIEIRIGWPFLCLGGQAVKAGSLVQVDGLIEDSSGASGSSAGYQDAVFIPYRPIWAGLLCNGAIYGAGLFILWNSLLWMRGAVRARSGRCAACGYGPLQGDVCSECGKPRAPRSAKGR